MAITMPGGHSEAYRKVIAKAWSDPAFKQRLLSEPVATLQASGIDISKGLNVKVVEDTPDLVHMILPAAPSSAELTDEALERMSGGQYISAITDCCVSYNCPPGGPKKPPKMGGL